MDRLELLCEVVIGLGDDFDLLDLGLPDVDAIVLPGDIGRVEHVVHELCHASDLSLDLGKYLGGRIGDKFTAMGYKVGVEREAIAWAAELEVWGRLGLPDLDEQVAVEAAAEQGVSEELLRSVLGSPLVLEVATHVTETIRAAVAAVEAAGEPC